MSSRPGYGDGGSGEKIKGEKFMFFSMIFRCLTDFNRFDRFQVISWALFPLELEGFCHGILQFLKLLCAKWLWRVSFRWRDADFSHGDDEDRRERHCMPVLLINSS